MQWSMMRKLCPTFEQKSRKLPASAKTRHAKQLHQTRPSSCCKWTLSHPHHPSKPGVAFCQLHLYFLPYQSCLEKVQPVHIVKPSLSIIVGLWEEDIPVVLTIGKMPDLSDSWERKLFPGNKKKHSHKGDVRNAILDTKGKICFSSFLSMQQTNRFQLTDVALYACHEAITVTWHQLVQCTLSKPLP